MSANTVLNFSELLRPIPGDNPAGVWLRASDAATYYAIRDARNKARDEERRLLTYDENDAMRGELPDPATYWNIVLSAGTAALSAKSKDLEITAWLIEALTRNAGFSGVRDGFRLARELIENFWDGIYPRPDEDDGLATTVAPLNGLNGEDAEGTLVAPLSHIAITDPTASAAFNSAEYRQATELERVDDADKRASRLAKGAVSREMFDRAVAESPPEFYRSLLNDIVAAQAEYASLDQLLEQKCGPQQVAVHTSNIRNALEGVREIVAAIAKGRFGDSEAALLPGNTGTAQSPHAAGPAGGGLGPTTSREQAFNTLLAVAEFFRRTEPHSPLSYALEQAVRWGKMPLPALLSELIPDAAVREQLFRQVGISKNDDAR